MRHPPDSANVAKLAVTIAIRYGVVRRQFAHGDGPEKQVRVAGSGRRAVAVQRHDGDVHARSQHDGSSGKHGRQILNYATHQFRLMPLLALTYAMHFGGVETTKIYLDCTERIEVRPPPSVATESRLQRAAGPSLTPWARAAAVVVPRRGRVGWAFGRALAPTTT